MERQNKANLLTAIAGFGAIIWIFTEMYATPIRHWLQILILALEISQLSLILIRLKILPPKKN